MEFPRIDDRLAGIAARYGHAAVAVAPGGEPVPGELLRYDLLTGSVARHLFGPGCAPSEAAFAPADDRPGGPGWLLMYLHDAATDTSDLVILGADDAGAPPMATVHLLRRVPHGFRGNGLPDC